MAIAATGARVPALEQAPEVSVTLLPALLALRDLDGERSIGMAAGPIPWRAILAWAKEYQVPCRESFIELVQAGDATLLEARNAAIERQSAADQRARTARHAHRGANDAIPRGRSQADPRAGAALGPRGRR